jgi:hypothetical protein
MNAEAQDIILKRAKKLCEDAIELCIPDKVLEIVQQELALFIDIDTDSEED